MELAALGAGRPRLLLSSRSECQSLAASQPLNLLGPCGHIRSAKYQLCARKGSPSCTLKALAGPRKRPKEIRSSDRSRPPQFPKELQKLQVGLPRAEPSASPGSNRLGEASLEWLAPETLLSAWSAQGLRTQLGTSALKKTLDCITLTVQSK